MLKCKKCGMEVNVSIYKRCPRCNAIVQMPAKCSECKGCSLYKSNAKPIMNCNLKQKNNI